MPQCLKCDKIIHYLSEEYDQLDGGGNVTIECHFGSRHDQGLDFDGQPLLAYICDDCIEKIMAR